MGRKSKAKSKQEQRPNPYSGMADADLESEYSAALAAYIERMEYFATLPEWMSEEFTSIHEKGPAAFGLSDGEWRQYCVDRWEHIVEGAKLGDLCAERHTRLYDAARAAVASCEGIHEAEAACDSYRKPCGPYRDHMVEGEEVRSFVMGREVWFDSLFESLGATSGLLESLGWA